MASVIFGLIFNTFRPGKTSSSIKGSLAVVLACHAGFGNMTVGLHPDTSGFSSKGHTSSDLFINPLLLCGMQLWYLLSHPLFETLNKSDLNVHSL